MMQQKRGKNVALAGAVLQTVFAAVMLVVWLWTHSVAAMAVLWMLVGGVPAWLMVALLFYCREMEQREALELEEISARGGEEGRIFEGEAQRELRLAARRLRFMERWGTRLFTLLWIAYHATAAILVLRYLNDRLPAPIASGAEGALFSVLIAFPAFLFGFYAVGMGRRSVWRVLRATGSYLVVNVLLIAAVIAALLASWQKYPGVDGVVAWVVAALQLVFAVELLVLVVFDLYRPRTPGVEERFPFDSRAFGVIAEPRRIGSSIADAVNYQFGFEVSRTWFYQLLSRAALPLLAFAAAVLLAMSAVVIVREGEQCVVQRWGRVDESRPVLEAGVHLRWPWPVERITRFNVSKVQEVLLGAGPRRNEDSGDPTLGGEVIAGRQFFLWTKEHGPYEELDFLVAVPRSTQRTGGPRARSAPAPAAPDAPAPEQTEGEQIPAVNIIKLVVSVQYRIRDVYDYGFRHADAKPVLQGIAYREMTKYCASATLHTEEQSHEVDRPQAIMTAGRGELADVLHQRIQTVADEKQLGIEVLYVGVPSVHPPAAAAPAYQKVLEAERQKEKRRFEAEATANRVLSEVAGDPTRARRVAFAISALGDFDRLQDMRSRPAEFRRALDDRIRLRRQDIEWIQSEIRREQLLGRSRDGVRTAYKELLDAYREQVVRLEAVRAEMEAGNNVPPDLAPRIADAHLRADAAFEEASGTAAVLVQRGQARRWEVELRERARAETYARRILPYHANPEVYMVDHWLSVLDQVLPDRVKYVLGVPRDRIEMWLNLEQQESPLQPLTFDKDSAKTNP